MYGYKPKSHHTTTSPQPERPHEYNDRREDKLMTISQGQLMHNKGGQAHSGYGHP